MSTEVSDSPAVGGRRPATDVFVAHRKQILAAIAPIDTVDPAPPAPPEMPPAPEVSSAGAEATPDGALDDSEGYPAETSKSAGGYLQFPSADDDDDDDELDDDDDDEAPQRAQTTARHPLSPQRLRDIDWKSPKVLIGTLAAVVLIVVLIIVFYPSPSPPPPLTITPAPPKTSAGPAPAPVDGPIKIESATSKCPAGSSAEAYAFDGANDTAWKCKTPYGPGQILTINLGDVYVVSGASILPGFNKMSESGDEWNKYQTVTKVRWLFGEYSPTKPCNLDNNCLEQNTDNARDVVSVPVIPNKKVSTIKMVILKTTPPPSDSGLLTNPSDQAESFAISEIQIIGHPAG